MTLELNRIYNMDCLDIFDYYLKAHNRIVSAGYEKEINYFRDLPEFKDCKIDVFFGEYVWCVLNAGMREQVVRKIYNKFMEHLDITTIGHPGKREAIKTALEKHVQWFGELKCAKDPVEYLQTLPWIGNITKYHLARNIGIDCVKPDRHLVKLAKHFKYDSPLKMVVDIQRNIPYERLGTIDFVLWRDCNLRSMKKAQEQGKIGTWFDGVTA